MKRITLFVLLTFTIQSIFSSVKLHDYASICPRSSEYDVSINQDKAFVYHTDAGSFVSFEADEEVEVSIKFNKQVNSAVVKPLRYNIETSIDAHTIKFKMPAEAKVMVEVNNPINDGNNLLFLYSNPFRTDKPDPNDPKVKYYKSGQVYDEGEIMLNNDETVFIEAGAVVRGNILAKHVKNATIDGYGVIDGGYYIHNEGSPRTILAADCDNVNIKNIIMINPPSWTLVTYYSSNVIINGIKQITKGNGRDGIDIVLSKDITVKNCILSCGDDCIVIKAFKSKKYPEPKKEKWSGCLNILVEDCILHGFGAQALEIGHELQENPVDNIIHRNIDVLAAHGQGGVFGIRNCESATVTNVLYENIRVDHYYNKLVDIRVIKSRYSHEEERGHIDGVTFKDIYVKSSKYNPGYSISLIGGYDENHKVKNVTFDNFQINGKKVTNGDVLDLFVKQAEGIVFK